MDVIQVDRCRGRPIGVQEPRSDAVEGHGIEARRSVDGHAEGMEVGEEHQVEDTDDLGAHVERRAEQD